MREIKFRAWDGLLKEYKHKSHIKEYDLYYLITLEGDFCFHLRADGAEDSINVFNENNRFVLEQYTGLHDKNEKEIYEGDIVREIDNEIAVSQIIWDDSFSGFTLKEADLLMDMDFKNLFEVVGNINENSELLKDIFTNY
jgi:uncharacterized phage protein (TIGR01671 family)